MKLLILSFILILTCCFGKYPCAYGESIELTAGVFQGAEPFYTSHKRNGELIISGMNIEIINAFVRKAPEFQIKLRSEMLPVPRQIDSDTFSRCAPASVICGRWASLP